MTASNNIMDDKAITELADDAARIRGEYNQKKQVVEQKILEWLRERMPVGTIINTKRRPISENPRPPYLQNITVMRGNARGTGTFRIERIRDVELNPVYPFMSRWNFDATPISEKTGKDMSATAGNHRGSTEFVGLRGYVGLLD